MANLVVSKVADKREILLSKINNRIRYTIIVENPTEDPALNVMIKDAIENGVTFIKESFVLNGYSIKNVNINAGINIGTLNPGQRHIIIYDAEIDLEKHPDTLSNLSIISYEYCNLKEVITTEKLLINIVNVNLNVIKRADREFVKLGDLITYYVNINNNSNIGIDDIIFSDDLEPNLKLILPSFTVNGVYKIVKDLKKGVNIGKLNNGSSLIVSFQAIAVSVPSTGIFLNQSKVDFRYNIGDRFFKGQELSNLIKTGIGPTSFKQITLDNTLIITPSKPGMEKVLNNEVEIKILSTNVIETIKATSCEGQRLTGHKVIIKGIILEQVEYVAAVEMQSTYLEEFNIPFTTSVVLNENYNGSNLEINAGLEDVYTRCLTERTLFSSITLMLQVNC